MKEIIDKIDLIRIRNFCSVKDSVKRIRRSIRDWEKISAKDTSDKESYLKYARYPLSQCMLNCFSCVRLFAILWTIAHQALFPWDSPGKDTGVRCHAFSKDLSDPGIKPPSLVSPALAGGFFAISAI